MSRIFEGLTQFADFLEQAAATHDEALAVGAGASAEVLYKNAYDAFGDANKLAELAEATQIERQRLGFAANEPLLRDGTLLRASLGHGHEGPIAGIGSAEPIFKYHEEGYVNARTGNSVPPRSTLKVSIEESEASVLEILQNVVGWNLGMAPSLHVLDTDSEIASAKEA